MKRPFHIVLLALIAASSLISCIGKKASTPEEKVKLQSITINPKTLELVVGDQQGLDVIFTPQDAADKKLV